MCRISEPKDRWEALLLVGPTGAGKTPLGDHLAERGWSGRRCRHFDFGRNLRAVASGAVTGFGRDQVAFVREVLGTGALLENESFHLAEKILRSFIDSCGMHSGELLILNGLPRHLGQARAVDRIVTVRTVIHLDCSAAVVLERLRLDSGGDRFARADDGLALVEKKLRDFEQRTAPLVQHYRDRGAAIHRREVGVATRPGDLVQG